jgi:hypothetical protein
MRCKWNVADKLTKGSRVTSQLHKAKLQNIHGQQVVLDAVKVPSQAIAGHITLVHTGLAERVGMVITGLVGR